MSEQTQPVAAAPLAVPQLIAAYISVRDKKAALKKAQEEQMKPLNDLLNQLDAALLDHCIKSGTDSVKVNGIGTAFIATKKSASIQDPDSFKQFVIDNEAWDMVSWSAKVEACEAHAKEHGALPPGVNLSAYNAMNVRRASKKAGEDE